MSVMNNQKDLQTKLKFAALLLRSNQSLRAERIYRNIIETYPNDFRAYFNLGQILYHSGNKDDCIEQFSKAVELDDTNLDCYAALSSLFITTNAPLKAAVFSFRGAAMEVRTSASSPACWYNLNVALRQIGLITFAISLSWGRMTLKSPLSLMPEPLHCATGDLDCSTLTVVCVKWGTKYGPEYVNNLYKSFKRYFSGSCRFKMKCFTDDSSGVISDVECCEFDDCTASWKGWWLKAYLFSRNLLEGWILYIDLDTIVCNSVDFFVQTIDSFGSSTNEGGQTSPSSIFFLDVKGFKNEGRAVGINSSIMIWHSEYADHHCLFEFLRDHYDTVTRCIYKFDHYLEMVFSGKDWNCERTPEELEMSPLCLSQMLLRVPSITDTFVESLYRASVNCSVELSTGSTDLTETVFTTSSRGENNVIHTQSSHPGQFVLRRNVQLLQNLHADKVTEFASLMTGDVHEDKESFTEVPHSTACPVLAGNKADCTAEDRDRTDSLLPQNFPYSIICFPLQPKPHEVDVEWIRGMWEGSNV